MARVDVEDTRTRKLDAKTLPGSSGFPVRLVIGLISACAVVGITAGVFIGRRAFEPADLGPRVRADFQPQRARRVPERVASSVSPPEASATPVVTSEAMVPAPSAQPESPSVTPSTNGLSAAPGGTPQPVSSGAPAGSAAQPGVRRSPSTLRVANAEGDGEAEEASPPVAPARSPTDDVDTKQLERLHRQVLALAETKAPRRAVGLYLVRQQVEGMERDLGHRSAASRDILDAGLSQCSEDDDCNAALDRLDRDPSLAKKAVAWARMRQQLEEGAPGETRRSRTEDQILDLEHELRRDGFLSQE